MARRYAPSRTVASVAERLEGNGRSRVAGNDQELDLPLVEQPGGLFRVARDRRRALGPIRQTRRVAKIDQPLTGQSFADRFEDGQATDI